MPSMVSQSNLTMHSRSMSGHHRGLLTKTAVSSLSMSPSSSSPSSSTTSIPMPISSRSPLQPRKQQNTDRNIVSSYKSTNNYQRPQPHPLQYHNKPQSSPQIKNSKSSSSINSNTSINSSSNTIKYRERTHSNNYTSMINTTTSSTNTTTGSTPTSPTTATTTKYVKTFTPIANDTIIRQQDIPKIYGGMKVSPGGSAENVNSITSTSSTSITQRTGTRSINTRQGNPVITTSRIRPTTTATLTGASASTITERATASTSVTATNAMATVNINNHMLPSAMSTTTAFYSGVKLAPPVQSAFVESVGSEQKAWYTIQVRPCDIMILPPTDTNSGAIINAGIDYSSTRRIAGLTPLASARLAAAAAATAMARTSIPRKPYKIYRRFEDVADFADQFEEEFPRLIAAVSAKSASLSARLARAATTPSSTKAKMGTTVLSTATTPAATRVMVSHSRAIKVPNPRGSPVSNIGSSFIGNSTTSIHDNVLNSCSPTERRTAGSGTSSLHSKNSFSSGLTTGNQKALSPPSPLTPPRLKSSLVLFVTKAVSLQRKGEIDRYLKELFALGPIITQSRLVAEFFGIWKTDMETHLRQEDRDPLALNTLANPITSSDATKMEIVLPESNKETQGKEQKEDSEKNEQLRMQHARFEEIRVSNALIPLMRKGHHSPPMAPCSPDSDSAAEIDKIIISRSESVSSSVSSHSTLTVPKSQSVNTTTMMTHPLTHLASPVLSPSPNIDFPPPPSGWQYELADDFEKSTQQIQSEPKANTDTDFEMTSPVETKVTTVFENEDISLTSPNVAQVSASAIMAASISMSMDSMEPESDITTRTIKKFKSLRRTNTSSRTQTKETKSQNDTQNQDDMHSAPSSKTRSNSVSVGTTPGFTSVVAPLVRSSSSAQAQTTGVIAPTTATSTTTTKSKIMKRSKTIVFRPEVTMQPLSSKNVIPPWNRIPSVAGNAASATSPASPISPSSPGGVNTQLPLVHSPNTVAGESITATTPTVQDLEDRPRKLTMSHSKTMSAISSTTASSFSSLSYWGLGSDNNSNVSGSSTMETPVASGTVSNNSYSCSSPTTSASRARSLSISSVSPSASALIAPWNRISPGQEANTHLHALVHHNQSSSSSGSTYVPVELGRSFHKKDGIMQKTHTMTNRTNGLNDRRPSVPVLSHPPEARNRTLSVASGSISRSFEAADVAVAPTLSKSKGMKKSGMTHSVSAPGGFLPTLSNAVPDTSLTAVNNRSSINGTGGVEAVQRKSSNSSSASVASTTTTKKRPPRRESVMSLHSPTMIIKQPVGILKNANSSANQNRKSSLTVPPGSSMFPVQSAHMMSSSSFSTSSAAGSTNNVGLSSPSHSGSSMATTFKIVIDADTIVALQVFEDKNFVLTLKELRTRVQGKLVKSNIQLPESFDLVWVLSSTSSASSSTLSTPVTATAPTLPSSNSNHRLSDPGVVLKSDEDLHRAIFSSKNRKVTLRCNM